MRFSLTTFVVGVITTCSALTAQERPQAIVDRLEASFARPVADDEAHDEVNNLRARAKELTRDQWSALVKMALGTGQPNARSALSRIIIEEGIAESRLALLRGLNDPSRPRNLTWQMSAIAVLRWSRTDWLKESEEAPGVWEQLLTSYILSIERFESIKTMREVLVAHSAILKRPSEHARNVILRASPGPPLGDPLIDLLGSREIDEFASEAHEALRAGKWPHRAVIVLVDVGNEPTAAALRQYAKETPRQPAIAGDLAHQRLIDQAMTRALDFANRIEMQHDVDALVAWATDLNRICPVDDRVWGLGRAAELNKDRDALRSSALRLGEALRGQVEHHDKRKRDILIQGTLAPLKADGLRRGYLRHDDWPDIPLRVEPKPAE